MDSPNRALRFSFSILVLILSGCSEIKFRLEDQSSCKFVSEIEFQQKIVWTKNENELQKNQEYALKNESGTKKLCTFESEEKWQKLGEKIIKTCQDNEEATMLGPIGIVQAAESECWQTKSNEFLLEDKNIYKIELHQ